MQVAIHDLLGDNQNIKQSIAALLYRFDSLTLAQTQEASSATRENTSPSQDQKVSNLKARPRRQVRTNPWTLGPLWTALGVQGRGVPTAQSHWQDHHMSFAIAAPLAHVIGNYALGLSVNVRTYNANPWSFQILRGSRLDISRIVPSTHPFLAACRRGDVLDIRDQLLTGEGRLSDRDDKNWTALAVSVMNISRSERG